MTKHNKIAIYPGSFDPITYGHLDIISRAAGIFGNLTVVACVNAAKPNTFSLEERKEFIERVTGHIPGVSVDICSELLVEYFRKTKADVIVKGLRAMSDFDYEFQMALANKDMYSKAETVFLAADAASTFLSSSMVKQIAMFGGDISVFVPDAIVPDICAKLNKQLQANIGG